MKNSLLPTRKLVPPALLPHLPRWMNNTSPQDLGVIRFGFELFPHTLKREFGIADWVPTTLYKILEWEAGMMKIDRAWAVCTSREYSKTTWLGKILPLYLMLVGQYGIYYNTEHLLPEADYIRLRAKNQDKAEEKMTNITVEFFNPLVVSLFGDLRPTFKEIRDEKMKNQGKLVILRNGYVFQASGLNQPARGANIRDKRPKVDINDDVENKENTKSVGMRNYNAKEILGEQFGGLDGNGLTIYVGNFVHQECLMAKMQKPNSGWKKLFFQASYFNQMGEEVSGWAKRYSIHYLRRLGEWYRNQPDLGGWKIFRMEYYNELVSDKEYIVPVIKADFVRREGMNFVHKLETNEWIRIHTIVAGDPAVSENVGTSNSVVSVIGFGSDNKRYVISVAVGKFDITDRYHDITKRPRILAISPEEMGNVKRIGMVSEMGRKIIAYSAEGFVLENAGQQLAWYNDLKEDVLRPLGISIPGLPYHPKDEKTYKLLTGLMNQISAGRYEILESCPNKQLALAEIASFPDSGLDVLDSWFNAEQLKRIPPKPNLDIDKFYDPAEAFARRKEREMKEKIKQGYEEWVTIG